jgi:hypothetical protein
MQVQFLPGREQRPLRLPDSHNLRPIGLYLGNGPNALEVVVTESNKQPSIEDLRTVWKARLAGRATPLLVVTLYPATVPGTPGTGHTLVSLCGPSGKDPIVVQGLELARVERLCAAALDEPDRHAALRLLLSVITDLDQPVIGLRNEGFFATHELHVGVPARPDWADASARGTVLLAERGTDLLKALGFSVDRHSGQVAILRVSGTKVGVALLLDRDQSPDIPDPRFAGVSPVSYAMQKADEERVRFVVAMAGPALRLYPTSIGVGTGRRGRTDTYVELRLDLLSATQAGYLWLLFSGDALKDGGTVDQILRDSMDYAVGLGQRLRDRIHGEVIPDLAKGLMTARRVATPTADDLAITYQMALTVLFRLLFVAYAEDKGLLPYRTNELYRRRSLKAKAHELVAIADAGKGFSSDTVLWDEIQHLFRAIDRGRPEWGVPEYNGGLFSTDPHVSPLGAMLHRLRLDDRVFGPVLTHLLVDQTPDGQRGPVDFRTLGVREFGTIYEGLLENELAVADTDLTVVRVRKDQAEQYRPVRRTGDPVVVRRGEAYLHTASGARKTTGSFFTKQFAVDHLLNTTLEPALEDHLARLDSLNDEEASNAFFDFRVADIAMGSGHFLVAAVDHIERRLSGYMARRPLPNVIAELARLRTESHRSLAAAGMEIEIEDTQLLRRQIARRCIYGVDLNPLAVELARLSLWIHTFVPGLPLSFLDRNLVVGNSLVGIATIDEAQAVLTEACSTPAGSLLALSADRLIGSARAALDHLARLSDATAAEIARARDAFRDAQKAVAPAAALFDVLTAARIDDRVKSEVMEHATHWVTRPASVLDSAAYGMAREALKAIPPLHFPIAFPEVFLRDRSGFDVIIGNPPWEEVTVEEDRFWTRHFPGLHALNQADQESQKRKLRRERPDLVAAYEREKEQAELLRRVLTAGSFPGMGTGDPDLYKAFTWRFWHLTCSQGGRIGVVLPRSAFCAKGSEEFRKKVFKSARVRDLTFLLNSGGWVFDDTHPQYTVALASLEHAEVVPDATIPIRGPYRSMERYERGIQQEPARFQVGDVFTWTDTAALPLLPDEDSVGVFAQLRKAPRIDLHDHALWCARPATELHATNDKHLMKLTNKAPADYWPVFKGETFDIWVSDTGSYYAWADPKKVMRELQKRRARSASRKNSVFREFPTEWMMDPATLPCLHPRIAFRDVTNRTNQRTVIAALVPPNVFLTNKAPYLLWPRGDEKDQAYLLGVLCSIPLDWYARRFVELDLNFHIFNPLPVPRPSRSDPLWVRTVEIAGRLAAQDSRLRKWASSVGVAYGPLDKDEKDDLIHELDAVVAHLYGLTEHQLRHVFETFHEGWDYVARLEATLRHYRAWRKRL